MASAAAWVLSHPFTCKASSHCHAQRVKPNSLSIGWCSHRRREGTLAFALARPPNTQEKEEAAPSALRLQKDIQGSDEREKNRVLRGGKISHDDIAGGDDRVKHSFNIVFAAAEAAPYSKTGGLGDVCGSLPISLASRGHRVMVITPRYMNGVTDERYSGAFDVQCRIKITCFGGQHEVAFFHEYRAGVDWVFVDHPSYHRPGSPYGDNFGAFGDNQFRFTLLCHAVCEAPLVLPLGGFTYGEKCLFIANDWHASLVPVIIAAKYRPYGVYNDARSILAIHNLAHQGVEPATTYGNLGLPPDWYGALEWVYPTWARKHALDRGEAVSHLKGAIVTADRILTVSEGYAWEITTSEGGWGLNELLQSRKSVINGITNGIDVDDWNPATDKYIVYQYSAEDLSGKAECKAALQKELGLPVKPDVPLIGFIGRLDYQKGLDLIQSSLPELIQDNIQFVMLGSGDAYIESWMKASESSYKDKFRGWVGFSIPVSHKITAGCDILLMPSRFEPCGLNQLYAMRYGTVPVVHCTGGLRDTVEDFNPFDNDGAGSGRGWKFSPLSKEAMLGGKGARSFLPLQGTKEIHSIAASLCISNFKPFLGCNSSPVCKMMFWACHFHYILQGSKLSLTGVQDILLQPETIASDHDTSLKKHRQRDGFYEDQCVEIGRLCEHLLRGIILYAASQLPLMIYINRS